jgi:nucleotide-binding universal stress UspA family protein
MRILVAVDESKSSQKAVEKIAQQFRRENAEVRIVHVLEPVSPAAPPQMAAGYAPELEALAKPARELLARAAKSLTDAGFKTETVLREGDIRETILDIAQEWKADLIVIGSRGRSGIQRFLLGSVTESVARHAPCSVEIVRV